MDKICLLKHEFEGENSEILSGDLDEIKAEEKILCHPEIIKSVLKKLYEIVKSPIHESVQTYKDVILEVMSKHQEDEFIQN